MWPGLLQGELGQIRKECQQMLLDHSKVRGLDSQTSIWEGQITDLVLESLNHVSVLICEPSQAEVFLSKYFPCISQRITKKTQNQVIITLTQALGALSMTDLETHLRKKSLRRVNNLLYYLLSNVGF